jgi:hypothetical protein
VPAGVRPKGLKGERSSDVGAVPPGEAFGNATPQSIGTRREDDAHLFSDLDTLSVGVAVNVSFHDPTEAREVVAVVGYVDVHVCYRIPSFCQTDAIALNAPWRA